MGKDAKGYKGRISNLIECDELNQILASWLEENWHGQLAFGLHHKILSGRDVRTFQVLMKSKEQLC